MTSEQRDVLDALRAGAEPTAFTVLEAVRVGTVDPDRLRDALREVVGRHPALSYRLTDDGVTPVWAPPQRPRFGWTVEEAEPGELARHAQRHLDERFDLAAGLLVRARLVRHGTGEDVLLLAVHHIAVDGQAMRLLIGELAERYAGLRPGPLPPVTMADVAYAERERLTGDGFAYESRYWRSLLGGAPPPDPLPADRPRLMRTAVFPEELLFRLTGPSGAEVRAFCARAGCSPFMALLAAVTAALADGREDLTEVRVATTISLRGEPLLLDVVGLVSTTAVLVIDLSDRPDPVELVRRVRDALLDAHAAPIPFGVLMDHLERDGAVDRTDIARVLVVAQDDDIGPLPGGWQIDPAVTAVRPAATTYDVVLSLGLTDEAVDGLLIYKGELHERGTIDALVRRFGGVLEEYAAVELP